MTAGGYLVRATQSSTRFSSMSSGIDPASRMVSWNWRSSYFAPSAA
jgi:hypothetical protein